MNTLHPHLTPRATATRFDWAGQIKLAIVLSVVAALTAVALASRVSEPLLIVGVIVVASVAGWARVQPVAEPVRIPIRVPVRHR
jgi:hypothetical protein